MQSHNLKRNHPNKKSRQKGRGGTRGKTAGRGTKGQNARAGHKKRPEIRDFIIKDCQVSASAKVAIEKAGGQIV